MADITRVVGTTSQIINFVIRSTASTPPGLPLTGLVYNSSGLVVYYKRNSAATDVAITLASGTLGTWSSGGFREVDSTNMPGLYELGVPNAALVSGADQCWIMLQGATNMVPMNYEIELTAINNQDAVRAGLSSLPNAAMAIAKGVAYPNFTFPMYDTNGNPKTGLGSGVTSQVRLDSGSFGATTNSPSEVAYGIYTINLSTSDTNGKVITLRFSATGAEDTFVTIVTQG
jgi:hypothetical protein